jgi:hypothetical protein
MIIERDLEFDTTICGLSYIVLSNHTIDPGDLEELQQASYLATLSH